MPPTSISNSPTIHNLMSILFQRLRTARQQYPRQFWLLFFGVMLSTTGGSMIWPFLMIYATKKLGIPLTTATMMMTLNSVTAILFSFISGSITDRVGRKWVMVASLALNAFGFVLLSQAHTVWALAIAMIIRGACNPLYQVGSDAMMADLIPAEKRLDAYSLLRTSNNVGVALGPVIGGMITSNSYTIAFFLAAACMTAYGVLMVIFGKETLPKDKPIQEAAKSLGGYLEILKDQPFIRFTLNMSATMVCASIMWVLLGVYSQRNFGLLENQYGWIPTTNALMVVFFQLSVTQITKRFTPLKVMAVGSLFYAIGVGSVAIGRGFWAFWLSMVIMTIGELIITPTGTAWAANRAPLDKRGRYMSIYGLTWGLASGVGPVLGGLLSDYFHPVATWYGAFLIGLLSTLAFLLASRSPKAPRRQAV
jgi:MFS family permease